MARTLLPIAGGVLGGMIGGTTGAQVGFALGSMIGSAVDPVTIKGPRIGETGAQTSAEGAPRGIVYGTAHVTGNVIASGEAVYRWVTERGGGKGGAPKTKREHVYRTFAIRICEGPIAGVLRVWEDDKLVYDVRPESVIVAESAKWVGNKAFHLGDEDQLPDPTLQAQVSGADDTPAYRGTAYIVVDSEDLTDRRGSIPQYRFEVASSGETVPLDPVSSTVFGTVVAGGTFPTGYSISNTLVSGNGPGEVWLAYLKARSTAGPIALSCYVRVDEMTVWSGSLAVTSDWSMVRCQLNMPNDGQEIVIGFEGDPGGAHLTGNARFGMARLSAVAVYRAYPGSSLPAVYAESDTYFGIVMDDSGDLFAAGDSVDGSGQVFDEVPWGPDSFERLSGGVAPLDEIVRDVARRCGMGDLHVDAAALTDQVGGLVLAGDYTGADAIDVLRRAYFFDRFESDGKIHFPKRGAAVVDVLTIDDLVEEPDTSTREQAIEYPAKTHLFYQHAASGYARVKATAQRSSPDVRVVGEQSVEVPVVLGEDEAARIADKLQKVAWADAEGEVTIVAPESFLRLTAADCIGLNLRGRVRRLRIEETGYADGRIEMKLRADRQSAYTSAVTGIPIPDPTPPPNTIIGATVLAVLDIPARADPEDDLNLYFAVSAVEPAWYGALVERSMDGGATFTDAAQLERSMRIGVLTADLGAASEHYTDTTNRVRVRLLRATHDVESITEQAFLSEGGSFAVQSAGGDWEILQYLDADDLGDQEFELSTLHRGRLATAAVAHATGALVVFLDDVEHTPAQASWIGQSLTHRATSFGETTEGVAEQTATYEGRSQIEWPIAYLMLERDSNDVVSGAWTPRHRFGSDDFPVPSINFEGFRVTIDDGGAAVVIETVAAEFAFDASAMASPVTVSVAALNRITGAGPATSDTV